MAERQIGRGRAAPPAPPAPMPTAIGVGQHGMPLLASGQVYSPQHLTADERAELLRMGLDPTQPLPTELPAAIEQARRLAIQDALNPPLPAAPNTPPYIPRTVSLDSLPSQQREELLRNVQAMQQAGVANQAYAKAESERVSSFGGNDSVAAAQKLAADIAAANEAQPQPQYNKSGDGLTFINDEPKARQQTPETVAPRFGMRSARRW